MSDKRDMSGVWYGRWTADDPHVQPNSFIALLEEAHGHLSGSITEPDLEGREPILRADVGGMRAASLVEFYKHYDGSGGLSHIVRYEGRINSAGTEIVGSWQFSQYSGGFEMQRETFTTEELEEDETIEISVR